MTKDAKSTPTPTPTPVEVTSKPRKMIEPTVKPPAGVSPLPPKNLPPIQRIMEPKMRHMSTKIRWYLGLGYEVGEVAKHLGVRYQQVRNVGVTEPKRAAREDVPPYTFELHELADDIESLLDAELERSLRAGRLEESKQRQRNHRRGN